MGVGEESRRDLALEKVREKKSSGRIVKPVPGWLAAGPVPCWLGVWWCGAKPFWEDVVSGTNGCALPVDQTCQLHIYTFPLTEKQT